MTQEQQDIERLKGELAAARWCIAFLFELALIHGGDNARTIITEKINSISMDTENDSVRHGVDHFKETLLGYLIDTTTHNDIPPQ